jgi:hypothetical protein
MRHEPTNHPEFQRAFAAVAYFAGVRAEALLAPFDAPSPELQKLALELGATEQAARAAALAHELERIARRLEARRLGP